MARIRTIKPDFWRHEGLSSLPEATHMLAAALLNYADDEGYFNANPKLIQAECCPLRELSVSIHESLKLLAGAGYLRLGVGDDGRHYGWILKFLEHQVINRPTPSKIKALTIMWDDAHTAHAQLSEPSSPERKGREQGKEGEKEVEGKGSAVALVAVTGDPKAPIDRMVEFYNQAARALDLPIARTLTDDRRARLRATFKRHGIEGWQAALIALSKSGHCQGRNDRGWRADLDFLLQPASFVRLIEGKYEDRAVVPKAKVSPGLAAMDQLIDQAEGRR
jgi:hypothetical protein